MKSANGEGNAALGKLDAFWDGLPPMREIPRRCTIIRSASGRQAMMPKYIDRSDRFQNWLFSKRIH